jgi:Holliday junction resolvase RusA-like endonuclease
MFLKIEYPPTCTNPKQKCRKREYVADMQNSLSNIRPLDGDIYVSAKFYPENYYLHRGDLDNLIKTLLDAIKGRCFYDDSQIRALYAVMMDSAPGNSHVELRIENHHKSNPVDSKNEDHFSQS